MSGFQRFSIALLFVATAGVFLVVGWLAFGDDISSELASFGSDSPTAAGDITIWAVGDSLMVAATDELEEQAPGIVIDAEVGRRMDEGIDVVSAMLEEATPDVLIVALGTNNGVTGDQIDEVMALALGVDKVVFVNVSVPRPWETNTNTVIATAVDAYPSASLVDWNSKSHGNIDLFRSDGFHLSSTGTPRWVDLIMSEAAG